MINKNKIFYFFAVILGILCVTTASAQQNKSLFVTVDTTKPCVKTSESHLITFKSTNNTLVPFVNKLEDVTKNGKGDVNIWHVGGSHVQAGAFSGRIRGNFATKINGGSASRTIMFPYKLIGTNGPVDYKVSGTGTWTKSKCTERSPKYEMGLSGVTAVSSSPNASVTFSMTTNAGIDWTANKITVLGKANGNVTPYLSVDGETIECDEANNESGYVFNLPKGCTSFTLRFHGLGAGKSFELRGVVALNEEPGVAYWASGVNGASTSSWLRCSLLDEELKLVAPDMVIFGIGINDAHTPSFKAEKFKANYQQIIDKIKAVNPNCHFLFVTNNDNMMKNVVNPNTAKVEQAFMELAQDNDGSVWDLYKVMGGFGGSQKWVASSLMQKDHIHFTRAGYYLIGDLLYNAIIEKYLELIHK